MKKYSLLFIILIHAFAPQAQKVVADSLLALLAKEKIDSNRVTLLWKAGAAFKTYNPDTSLLLAQEAYEIAERIKFVEGESRALGIMANGLLAMGNYPRALEYYFKKLQLEEKRNRPGNLTSVTMNIGIVYISQEEFDKGLQYYYRADSICEANNLEEYRYSLALNLGDAYDQLNKLDSAYFYYSKSLMLAQKKTGDGNIGISLTGLGHIYTKQGNYLLAGASYKSAIIYLEKANVEDIMCEAETGLANLYLKQNKYDSAKFYANKALQLAIKDGFLQWQLKAAEYLNILYRKTNRYDSAYTYLTLFSRLQDSISSKERIRESQNMTMNEQLRQTEIAIQKKKAKKERQQQLQLLFIGIFIPALFLFTLIVSRRRIPVWLIKSLGIISLLILFEYLTLLLHPYVLEITNHTPIYEMLIFCSIAAVLIRAHHRIEHWFVEKLVLRNQRISEGKLHIRKARLKMKMPPGNSNTEPEGK